MNAPGPLRRVEFAVLLAGLAVVGGVLGLVELIGLARRAEPHEFDAAILIAFREPGRLDDPLGPLWLEEAMRDLTSLGSTIVLVLLTAAVFVYLLIARRAGTAFFVLGAVAGGQVLSSLMKLGIDRPRPELVSHLAQVYTGSFPSGHAMLSAVTYLTLGSLLARAAPERTTRIYFICIAILLTFLVGVSRVYLGVHWPSDVLAGWCAGFAWAMLCWLVMRWLRPGGAGHKANG